MKKRILILILFLAILINIFPISLNAEDITGETITGNVTSQQFGLSISISGTPLLTIIKPENETYLTTKNLLLNYSSIDEDYVWYNIDLTGGNTTITSATYFNTTSGPHVLYLYANNTYGESSESISFNVNSSKFKVYYSEWAGSNKGSSTDFNESSYEDIQNLSGVILEHTQHGKIKFNEVINLTDDKDPTDRQINIIAYINISSNKIEINSTALPNFNKSATLRLYNLTLTAPVRILKDGSVCPSTICTQQSYTGRTLIFNVTQFTVYSAEEIPSGTTPPPGGGGGGTITKDFSVDKEKIHISLKQGETKQESIFIKNTGGTKITINIESINLKDFLKINETSFRLNSGESKTLVLNFSAGEDSFPNLYIGKLIIKANGIERDILIAVEVESEEPLFDVELEIPKRYLEVSPGEEILVEVKLYNIGTTEKTDVEVEYIIKDENNNIVTTKSETIAVETRAIFTQTVLIPKNAEYGRYMFYVRTTYDSRIASASTFFEVVEPGISGIEKIYILSIIFLILLTSILIYYFIRHRIKTHKKIVKKIGIKDILKI